ncbi:catechol 2,3-dioxygenase [Paracoccus aminovorans]|uniref:Catechol 2,3-dioxygenase n=1 Tax=Paracoccus aminovorans TaxID=34004 RepID=A0A1I3C8V3_9RHOB|nr:VOC family protein [Paracoccus aminovorans]CQR87384.1 glyoxalase/bleomycin resistance protein/dioxygenase [Paracoccus aminovorans]SFH70942.1 catechol 2,3-dioxygenase [Paracoccus aminovorans]
MATSDAPLQVSQVALIVNDLDRVGDFYRSVIGLERLSGSGEDLVLGAGDLPLLELRRDAAARRRPHEAGLFHTAFLLPDRRDLGAWLRHAAGRQLRLDGASDHLVSEALYLRDPEGNGIELYADRPRAAWQTDGRQVRMDTLPLDLQTLAAAADRPWTGAPQGSVVGHVHLQVGDIAEAEAFYMGRLGMDRSAQVFGASFFATGGYHHHLAGNIWQSRGAGRRSPDSTGLAEVVLAADAAAMAALPGQALTDPWGTRFRIAAKG